VNTVGSKLEYKDDRFTYRPFFRAKYHLSKDHGEESANKLDVRLGVRRDTSSRAYVFVRGDAIVDRFAGYNLRSSVQAGPGYTLFTEGDHKLTAELAALLNYDRLAGHSEEGVEDTEDYTSGRFGLIYSWQINGRVKFEQELDYSMELGDGDRDFLDSETGLNVELVGNLSLGLRYSVNYQETPPSPDIEKTDTTFLTALVWDI
jgi:putative salt-induced outer membrane protein